MHCLNVTQKRAPSEISMLKMFFSVNIFGLVEVSSVIAERYLICSIPRTIYELMNFIDWFLLFPFFTKLFYLVERQI